MPVNRRSAGHPSALDFIHRFAGWIDYVQGILFNARGYDNKGKAVFLLDELTRRRQEGDSFLEEEGKIADRYWRDLAARNPSDICRRSLARYNESEKAYELKLLSDELLICADERKVVRTNSPINQNDPAPDFNTKLVSVHYLLGAQDVPMACEYVTGNQLTDGDFFFKGPHALPSWRIEKRLGHNAAGFLEKGKLIGGTPVAFGDAAIELLVLPRIRIAYVLWVADDEFPARSQILFDATADRHFALDVVWAMCNLVTDKLLKI